MEYGQKYLPSCSRAIRLTARLAVMVQFAALLLSPSPALAQISLGAAEGLAVLGGSAVTCTGAAVTGNVGVDFGAVTETACTISGTVHVGDTIAQQAHDDFLAAYAALAAEPCGTFLTGLSGRTLLPGVYCVAAAATETGGVLTLDGLSTDRWVFKIGTGGTGALTGTGFSVVMPGGQTCNNNVFWWTAQAATLTDSVFLGSILAGTSITVTRGSLDGQALAPVAVTLTGPSVCGPEPPESLPSSGPGDIFISLEYGVVQWRAPDGALRGILGSTMGGTTEGLGFDAAGNLYVGRWRHDTLGNTGNTVEVFNSSGQSTGRLGRDYDCDPRVTVFDAAGNAYVGEAGCRKAILKFAPGQAQPTVFAAAPDQQGVFWMDLGPDGCTMYYTSIGPNVKRYDVCADAQLPDFNVAPLPGGETHDLRVLPDGGVLVSSGAVIARLDAGGVLTRTYQTGTEPMWVGLDLVGDGTFWVGGYYTSNLHRFDLDSGAVVASFNSGTPASTVIGVKVKK